MIKELVVGSPLFGVLSALRDWIDISRTFFAYPPAGPEKMEARCGAVLLPSIGEGVFIDVGSHIGSVVAAVRRHRRAANIIAIEADPAKARRLGRRFPDIVVHQIAVGSVSGETDFFVDPLRPGFSSTVDRNDGRTAITVGLTTLDELLAGVSNIDVIKIDVEGAEPDVISGASQLLRLQRPLLYFESAINPGDRPAEIFKWLNEFNYEIFLPSRLAHDAPPMSKDCFLEAHLPPRRALNFFAVHREKRMDYRDRARRILGIKQP